MQDSMYHVVLRTSALTLSLVLLFVSGVISPATGEIADSTERYLASAIGMYAAVEPNEVNTITAALTAKETELANREAALREREVAVGINASETANDYSTYILSVILFILLVLIITNYILDFLRVTDLGTAKLKRI